RCQPVSAPCCARSRSSPFEKLAFIQFLNVFARTLMISLPPCVVFWLPATGALPRFRPGATRPHQAGSLPFVSPALRNVAPALSPQEAPGYPVVYNCWDVGGPQVHILNVRRFAETVGVSVPPDAFDAAPLKYFIS